MAKKKNQSKKHKFKYGSSAGPSVPSSIAGEVNAVSTSEVAKPTAAKRPDVRRGSVQPAVFVRDFSYVSQDLRRIGILAASLVGLEVIIWLVFGHTGIGSAVYHFVQV